MTKVLKNCFFIIALLLPSAGFAQQPARFENLAVYKDALELFDKAKYGAAAEKFTEFISISPALVSGADGHDLVADSRFYLGACAFNLLRNNTFGLFNEFIAAYPEHSRVNEAWFYTGKLHFIRKEYQEVLPALENVDATALEQHDWMECHYMRGYCYYADKDYPRAIESFNRIRKSEGEFADKAAYYYALINYQTGNYAEALSAFEDIKGEKSLREDVVVYKANCLLKLGRHEELKAVEDSLSEDNTPGTEVAMLLGNAAYERGDFARARDLLVKCSTPGSGMDRDGHYRLAMSYYETGDFGKASDWFEKALRPEDSLSQAAHYYLAQSFVKLNNLENARTAFRKASRMNFDKKISEEALYNYAKASFEARYMEDALSALRELMEDYPSSVYKSEAGGLIGEILLNTSNFKDAVDYLEQPGNLKTDRAKRAYQRAAFFYGIDLYQKHSFEKAADYFKKSFNQKFDPEIALSAYFWYAESVFHLGDYGQALDYYQDYLEQPSAHKHNAYAKAWYGIAWCQFKLEKFSEAGRTFSKFIGLANKDMEPELYVDALLRAGDCELVGNKYKEASNYYTQVRDFNDRQVDYALYQLGGLNFRTGDYENSLASYQRLVSQFKKSEFHDDALLNVSEIYLTWLEKPADALKNAKMLVTEHPESALLPEAYVNMGIAAYNLKDEENAVRYFKTVVFDYCSHPKALDALENLNSLLSGPDYDRVFASYQEKCPDRQVVQGDQRMEELIYNNGVDRYYAEEYASAIEKFTNYLRDYPKGKHTAEVRYLRGECFEKSGNIDSALAIYESVYKGNLNSWMVKALQRSAEIHFGKGNFLSAIELFTSMDQKAEKLEDRLAAQFGIAKAQMSMGNYDTAKQTLMGIYTDPNTTEYSRLRAYLMIGNCNYALGAKEEAEKNFNFVIEKDKNAFGAEAQYMIVRILYDKANYEQSEKAAIYLNQNYSAQNYWKGKAFLILAEDYLAMGDTFQAVEGTLRSLAEESRFPEEIRGAATKRMEEIRALYKEPGSPGDIPHDDGKKEDEE